MPDKNPRASGDTVEEKRQVYLLNNLKNKESLQNRLNHSLELAVKCIFHKTAVRERQREAEQISSIWHNPLQFFTLRGQKHYSRRKNNATEIVLYICLCFKKLLEPRCLVSHTEQGRIQPCGRGGSFSQKVDIFCCIPPHLVFNFEVQILVCPTLCKR